MRKVYLMLLFIAMATGCATKTSSHVKNTEFFLSHKTRDYLKDIVGDESMLYVRPSIAAIGNRAVCRRIFYLVKGDDDKRQQIMHIYKSIIGKALSEDDRISMIGWTNDHRKDLPYFAYSYTNINDNTIGLFKVSSNINYKRHIAFEVILYEHTCGCTHSCTSIHREKSDISPRAMQLAHDGWAIYNSMDPNDSRRTGYIDADPETRGKEFRHDGKYVVVDSDGNGHHETIFIIVNGELEYVGALGGNGAFAEVASGYECLLGRYKGDLSRFTKTK